MPFRPVASEVPRWLDRAEREGSKLAPLARELFAKLDTRPDWLVHGDFHHHNILRHRDRFVAIDPKPYLSEREYDVPAFLWNPLTNRMEDREQTERRIAAFVAVRPGRVPDPRVDGDQRRVLTPQLRRPDRGASPSSCLRRPLMNRCRAPQAVGRPRAEVHQFVVRVRRDVCMGRRPRG